MIEPYPIIDSRRTKKLVAELKRLAEVFVPALRDIATEDSVGHAMVEITARLAGQVTQRLDRVPRRDVIAFFHALDIPQEAPRTAQVPLVFTLSEKREKPVYVPARVQVAASGENGEDVIFETRAALNLTPARLSYIAAVDTTIDHIEEPPPQFFQLAPPDESINYLLETLASESSYTLQISPAIGLKKDDIIGIDSTVYRVEALKNGLATLAEENPLEQSFDANTPIRKVTRFDVFQLRNLQQHIVYIGHAEALNLEQPSNIRLVVTPPSVASSLANLGLIITLYGTDKNQKVPGWQPLKLISASGGELLLNKDWLGTVDEYSVHGEKSRWLKLQLQSMNDAQLADMRIASFKLRVESGGAVQPAPSNANSFVEQQSDDKKTEVFCIECKSIKSEGSDTVKQAFYNATPLPLITSFFPFGMEPLRFDTFALAAPEALSKKGAKVAIAINLVDATPVVLELANSSSETRHVYSIGVNGRLQIIELIAETGVLKQWQELGHPQQLPEGNTGSEDFKTLRLDSQLPNATEITNALEGKFDLVIVCDRGGRLWLTKVSKKADDSFIHTDWKYIPSPPNSSEIKIHDYVLYPLHLDSQAVSTNVTTRTFSWELPFFNFYFPIANLFAATDSGFYQLTIDTGAIFLTWVLIDPADSANNDEKPAYSFKNGSTGMLRLVPILTPQYPSSSDVSNDGLVLLDADGLFWHGKLTNSEMNWVLLDSKNGTPLPAASSEVRPVAAKFGDESKGFVVFGAGRDNSALFALFSNNYTGPESLELRKPQEEFIVQSNTELLCDPSFRLNDEGNPFLLAFGQDDINSPTKVAIWLNDEFISGVPQGRVSSSKLNGVLLPQKHSPPSILINGGRETIYQAKSTPLEYDDMAFELYDWVQVKPESHYMELIGNGSNKSLVVLSVPAIRNSESPTYALEQGTLSIGKTYNLYTKLSDSTDSFKGILVEGNSSLASKTKVEIPKNGDSVKLELDSTDNVTINNSKLVINDCIYSVQSIETSGSTKIATLDISPGSVGDKHLYIPIGSINETPLNIEASQLATLLKLTGVTEKPSRKITSIKFDDPSSPNTQTVKLTDDGSGAVWALLNEEWTNKPTSESATVSLQPDIGEWSAENFQRVEKNPELSWEYHNGKGWRSLEQDFNDTTNNLAVSGRVCFRVPNDIAPTEISGKNDFWIRTRLVGGNYGQAKYVATTITDKADEKITKQTITVDNSEIRAPEILAIEACFQMDQELPPDIILTENNREVFNQTQANGEASATFTLFEGATAIDPNFTGSQALYFGFTKSYDVNPLILYVDAEEPQGVENFPETIELEFEVLSQGENWRKIAAEDLTRGFQHRGFIKLFVAVAPQRNRLFGRELFWLRVYPVKNAEKWNPLLKGIYLNAADAEQARSIKQEVLGASSGEPNQRFFLSKPPIISNSLELRVREALSEDERLELEQAKKISVDRYQQNSQAVDIPIIATFPDITGEWVLWRQSNSFVGYDGDARIYQLDPASGAVRFGDGKQGKIPPAGRDAVRAISYQNGGGEAGNVEAFTIEGLKSSVESVDRVTNPIAAAGGVGIPDLDLQIITAPDRLRHRQQALTPLDIEALTVAWSSEIVRARCIPPLEANDPITVYIARQTGDRCPKATLVERDALARYLLDQGWGALDDGDIRVYNPDYVPVSVTVDIVAESSETVASVEKEARERLLKLLHPIEGGPDGTGWPFGRGLWKSDLFRALAGISGLDWVKNIDLNPELLGVLSSSSLIYAEEKTITVNVSPGQGEIQL